MYVGSKQSAQLMQVHGEEVGAVRMYDTNFCRDSDCLIESCRL